MSQFYLAATKFHPAVLQMLIDCVRQMHRPQDHVMVNNPAKRTGPGAVKRGMIAFQRAVGDTESNGYLDEGVYAGGIASETLANDLPWFGVGNDPSLYPTLADLTNRTVTVRGSKLEAQQRIYIHRNGLGAKAKHLAYAQSNMTHFLDMRKKYPRNNIVSCQQHSHRMATLVHTSASWYYQTPLSQRIARYEYNATDQHYYDPHTHERMETWSESEWQ